ncbi:hypothetical protein ACFSWD_03910 [Paenibacillus xanthanilyticus]
MKTIARIAGDDLDRQAKDKQEGKQLIENGEKQRGGQKNQLPIKTIGAKYRKPLGFKVSRQALKRQLAGIGSSFDH